METQFIGSAADQRLAAGKVDPLDHDNDGKRGGSLKGERATAKKEKTK